MNDAQVQAAVDQLKSAGGQADGFVMNVTNRKNIDEVVAAVIERYGRIDSNRQIVCGHIFLGACKFHRSFQLCK